RRRAACDRAFAQAEREVAEGATPPEDPPRPSD
ncbi:MAG: hypothetical protein JWN08_3327, partial [Frankiales bacterium]|nr:hypothetical protein [Frankiales bacterium]